jgi:GMP synthase (glutamine-hydrolysing)
MSATSFLLLETGKPIDALRRHGGFAHWIRVAAGLQRHEVTVCRVATGEPLPAASGWLGVVITGSAAMVTERQAWSEASAEWLRGARGHRVPMLGICYGHQLLAHAFGGGVGDNPAGREIGTQELELDATAGADPLFAGLPARVRAHTTHLQTVLAPPPGATVLARSSRDACQAFRLDDRVWGLQFHPEFSAGAMRAYIAGRAEALRREGEDPQRLHRAVRPAPLARRVLRRFVHHARRPR